MCGIEGIDCGSQSSFFFFKPVFRCGGKRYEWSCATFFEHIFENQHSLVNQTAKNLPAVWETWV